MRKQHSILPVHFILLPDVLAEFIFYAKVCGGHTRAGILEKSMGARN
jgi:hypothetical protein